MGIDLISKIAAVFSHRHDRVLRRSLPSFLPFRLPFPSQARTVAVDVVKVGKGSEEESARTRRPVSIDSLERRLESAGREIEIRIEFARIEIGPGGAFT